MIDFDKPIDIINHSVKINDIGILQFMYPNFIILDKPVLFSDKPIIYTGNSKYINNIKALGVDYISVTELAEIDMTQRDVFLNIVFSHHNRKVPKYLQAFYKDLDDSLFRELCEQFWITGKWPLKEYDNTGAFLEFLDSFKTDTLTITKTYLQLLNKVGAEYIEMSMLTFLNRVVINGANVSKWYRKVINNFKLSKGKSIEPAITNYANTEVYNSELRVLNLILDLNKRY